MDTLKKNLNIPKQDQTRYFSPELKTPVQLSVTSPNSYTTQYTFTNKMGGCIDVILVI